MVATQIRQETLERSSVSSIAFKGKSHTLRNSLLGLGIGAVVGAGLGAIDYARNTHAPFLGFAIPEGFVIGAQVGLGVGGLWPTGGWREVYRSK